jgi:type I restriction enzyme, S subunit
MCKKYQCNICNSKPDQLSHHNKHLITEKHKDKRSIFELQLKSMSKEDLEQKYKTTNIEEIIKKNETKEISKLKIIEKTMDSKKYKTNTLIYENSNDTMTDTKNNESFKYKFLDFLGKMHNLLRGSGVTGDEALDDILNCLFLCYIEDKISEEGDFDLANSDKSCYKGIIQKKVKDYVKYLKVSYLLNHKEELRVKDGTNSISKYAKLLSKHPTTSKLFKKDEDFINCPDIVILSKLLTDCQEFSKEENIFENLDITGIAYEYMTTKHGGNGGTSKEMGQYFTERPLMGMCFQLIDETDIIELKIDNNSTMGDEFCATFGFPLMARRFLNTKFNIHIQDKNMYGVEYHERLSRFAIMNSMFSMKNFKNIVRGNSFITNVTPHLDISIHNVPMGKTMEPKLIETNYEGFLAENPGKEYPTFKEYIPFNKKKIDAILTSQVVLFKTKKMGLMITKDGEETSGKSNSNYRKWFSENCIIKKIMKIPSGAFTCTGTKTVCIYFIKKEGQMTENIQFLQLSDDGNKITEICKVSMDEMSKNNYSWDPTSYIIDEEMEKMMSNSKFEWKTLGEVCEIANGKSITKKDLKDGKIPVVGGGVKPLGFHNIHNIENNTIIISKDGANAGYVNIFKEPIFATGHCLYIKNIDACITKKYLYFIMKRFENKFYALQKGGAQPGIDKNEVIKVSIPIPSLETQNQVVLILDDLAEQKQLLSDRKSGINRQMKYYFETQIKNNEVEIKELQEIIKINIGSTPPTINNDYWTNGDNVWISVSELNNNLNPIIESKKKLTNKAVEKCKPTLVKKGTILMSFKLSIGKLGIAGCDLYTNEAILHINTNNDELNRYLYYHILSIPIDNTASGCMGGGSLNKEKLKVLNMYIQKNSKKQTEIVQYLDKLEAKKNSIDEDISDIENLMKQVLEQSYN